MRAILDACRQLAIETPTLCYGDTLTPVNVCRVCVVEVEGARALARGDYTAARGSSAKALEADPDNGRPMLRRLSSLALALPMRCF